MAGDGGAEMGSGERTDRGGDESIGMGSDGHTEMGGDEGLGWGPKVKGDKVEK